MWDDKWKVLLTVSGTKLHLVTVLSLSIVIFMVAYFDLPDMITIGLDTPARMAIAMWLGVFDNDWK